MPLIRHALRLFIISTALLAALTSPVPAQHAVSDDSAVALREVRLRKLHLVRPDLIPYPLCYEVLC